MDLKISNKEYVGRVTDRGDYANKSLKSLVKKGHIADFTEPKSFCEYATNNIGKKVKSAPRRNNNVNRSSETENRNVTLTDKNKIDHPQPRQPQKITKDKYYVNKTDQQKGLKDSVISRNDRQKTAKNTPLRHSDKATELKIDNYKPVEKCENNAKPIIKTITSPDSKVYKEVIFDGKQTQKRPLQINLPSQSKPTEYKEKGSNSTINKIKAKDKEIKVKNNKICNRKRLSSPEVLKKPSPKTEIARWGNSSVSSHTKPYYEAWVSTTLAAVSKISNQDKDKMLIEKDNIIECLQRALANRTQSPDIAYNILKDQKYVGKIKVNTINNNNKYYPLI